MAKQLTDTPASHVLVDIDVDRGRTWSPKQLQYIYSAHRYPIMYGGYRSGKTDALVRRALRYSLKWPGNRGLMARYSLGESYDTLLVNWAQVVPPELYEISTDRWGWQITVKTEGAPSTILVRALDEPQKYESLELGWAAVSQMNEQYITKRLWDTLDSRLTWKLPDGTYPHLSCFGEANSGAKWIIDLWGPARPPWSGSRSCATSAACFTNCRLSLVTRSSRSSKWSRTRTTRCFQASPARTTRIRPRSPSRPRIRRRVPSCCGRRLHCCRA